jgi:hypothetical protein
MKNMPAGNLTCIRKRSKKAAQGAAFNAVSANQVAANAQRHSTLVIS